MPIYEIKNTDRRVRKSPEPVRSDLDPVDMVSSVKRVGRFKREWRRRRGYEEDVRRGKDLTSEERSDIRLMIDQVNDHLDAHGILVHLVLVRDKDGYCLDVYDCTDEKVCAIVRDFVVNLDELPTLLRNLHQEAGLVIDTLA